MERAAQKGSNLSALCEEFGVSRQTGHKWLRRYREPEEQAVEVALEAQRSARKRARKRRRTTR